jgi:hypothetical protein
LLYDFLKDFFCFMQCHDSVLQVGKFDLMCISVLCICFKSEKFGTKLSFKLPKILWIDPYNAVVLYVLLVLCKMV